jgi:integral membrane sensor domain MASE1
MTSFRISPAWFTLACIAGAELGQLFFVPVSGSTVVPALWPPTGLLAAALILGGRPAYRRLPVITLAVTAASMALHHRPLAVSAVFCAIGIADACFVAWIVRRILNRSFTMHRVADILVLVLAAGLVPIASGALAGGVLHGAGEASWLDAWRSWWLAESLGIFFVTPLATEAIAERRSIADIFRGWRGVELAVAYVGGVAMTEGIFAGLVPTLVRVPAYVLPFLLWPALRFGPFGTSLMIVSISLVGVWNSAHGQGPFVMTEGTPAAWTLRAQGAMVILGASFLLFAGIIAERKRDAQERARLILELQQALAEIKTLQGLIPICAWCHQVRDDAGFWQKLETYLGAETGATFSHSICPACEQRAHDEITKHGIELPL